MNSETNIIETNKKNIIIITRAGTRIKLNNLFSIKINDDYLVINCMESRCQISKNINILVDGEAKSVTRFELQQLIDENF